MPLAGGESDQVGVAGWRVVHTKNMGGSAGLRAEGVVVVVMGKFRWCPQTLEQQNLCSREFALLGDMGLCY